MLSLDFRLLLSGRYGQLPLSWQEFVGVFPPSTVCSIYINKGTRGEWLTEPESLMLRKEAKVKSRFS